MENKSKNVIFILTTPIMIAVASASQCPQNSVVYHGNGYAMCYWVTTDEYYPNAGHVKCQEDGGMIGEIPDIDAQEFLKCAIPPISKQSLWIGYNDIAVENQHVNWNGDPMTWHFMWGGGPSDSGGEDCMEWLVNVPPHVMWIWNDARCDLDTHRVLCSKRLLGVEEVDRVYTRLTGQDFAYFYKVTTNIYNELGAVVKEMEAESNIGCLASVCVSNRYCLAASYDSVTGVCIAFTCPKMDMNNITSVPEGSQVWIVQNYG